MGPKRRPEDEVGLAGQSAEQEEHKEKKQKKNPAAASDTPVPATAFEEEATGINLTNQLLVKMNDNLVCAITDLNRNVIRGMKRMDNSLERMDSRLHRMDSRIQSMMTQQGSVGEQTADVNMLPTHVTAQLKAMKTIHELTWDLASTADYNAVFHTRLIDVPTKLTAVEALQPPGIVTGLQLKNTTPTEQKFMDLTNHSNYPEQYGRALLPGGSDRLLILESYEQLMTKLVQRDTSYCTFDIAGSFPPSRNAIISGSPGIGKTCFGDFALVSRLSKKLPTAVQNLELRGEGYFLFDETGVSFVRENSADELEGNLQKKNIWVLLDDYPLKEFGNPHIRDWMFVWTSSSDEQYGSKWGKEVNASRWYLDAWSWEEIWATSYHRGACCQRRLAFLYVRYGGIPRTLLKTIGIGIPDQEMWTENIMRHEMDIALGIGTLLSSSGPWPSANPSEIYLGNASGNAMILRTQEPGTRCSARCKPEIATEYIVELITEAVLVAQKAELCGFYRRVMGVPELRTAAGRVLDKMVHEWLDRETVKTYKLRDALGSAPDPILPADCVFQITRTEEFHSLAELGPLLHLPSHRTVRDDRKDIYVRPMGTTFKSVDSFTRSSKHNKVTIADDHPVIANGIKNIMKELPAMFPHEGILLFIVSTECKLKTPQAYKPVGCSDAVTKNFQQRILYVTEEELFEGR